MLGGAIGIEVLFYFLYIFVITVFVESKTPVQKAPHTCSIPESKGQKYLQRLRLNLQNKPLAVATLLRSFTFPNGL